MTSPTVVYNIWNRASAMKLNARACMARANKIIAVFGFSKIEASGVRLYTVIL